MESAGLKRVTVEARPNFLLPNGSVNFVVVKVIRSIEENNVLDCRIAVCLRQFLGANSSLQNPFLSDEDSEMKLSTPHKRALLRRRFSSASIGAAAALMVCSLTATALAQTTGRWQKLTNQPPFQTDTALLLTDGSVLVHEYSSSNTSTPSHWWRLVPDINGSYANGTWVAAGDMGTAYSPLYFASALLRDGRVLVEGGEYNHLQFSWTNQGAIYDPLTNTWTPVSPPSGWSTVGDAPAAVLPDGTFTMGRSGGIFKSQVLFNESNLTWTNTGTGKADGFEEEGFALLPNGKLLTVDTQNIPNSELYDPASGTWSSGGSTIVTLADAGSLEIGPLIQRPNGTVVSFGGTPHTAIYNTSTGTWAAGPDFPGGNDVADGPGAILPNGEILIYASPGVFSGTGTFFTYDGTSFTPQPATDSSRRLQSWQSRMLVLPTGEVMWLVADGSTKDVELFQIREKPFRSWAPVIQSVPATLTRGGTFQISGQQFNGLSCGADYGDDATMATNYPLVRITNDSTGHIFYARTHDHSTMAIATGNATVSTMFDVPNNVETGLSRIAVVANGIPSRPKAVTIQ